MFNIFYCYHSLEIEFIVVQKYINGDFINQDSIDLIVSANIACGVVFNSLEITILCCMGAAAIPTIPIVLANGVAQIFFGLFAYVAEEERSLDGFLITSGARLAISITFVVTAVSFGIIGPLGVAVYSSLIAFGSLTDCLRVIILANA